MKGSLMLVPRREQFLQHQYINTKAKEQVDAQRSVRIKTSRVLLGGPISILKKY